jgi:hypothetical protein
MVYYLVKKHTPEQRTTAGVDKNLKLIF